MCGVEGSGGVFHMDTIEYQGGFWLVPEWLKELGSNIGMPARLIRLDSLPHQKTPGSPLGDFVLNNPLPKDVVDRHSPVKTGSGYEVIQYPDLQVRIP